LPPSEAAPGLGDTAARQALLRRLDALALAAGSQILTRYTAADLATDTKADGSPVTEADEAAERVILDGLAALGLGLPVVAEEAVAAGRVPATGTGPFVLVDPLDGTREFLSRNGEFTVNIAVIEDGRPVLGVVYAPALGERYTGLVGDGAWRRRGDGPAEAIAARPLPADGAVVVASRSHGDPARIDAWLGDRAVTGRKAIGSSLKFCLIAAGEADLYPRFGRTMEWDTAAGHAVLAAAGGRVETLEGVLLSYGKAGFENPDFVARGA
jgi:3'(2'), 5'-bisphosphate nucleotidase